jgi:hypothetical protein
VYNQRKTIRLRAGSIIVTAISGSPVMIHAPGILRVRVLIYGRSTVLLRKKFFDLPGIGLNAHRELEVFFCDVIPELQD